MADAFFNASALPNPASGINVEEKIGYERDGTMIVPQEWDIEINKILNLNAPVLILNRKNAWEAFLKVYPKLRETFSDHRQTFFTTSSNSLFRYTAVFSEGKKAL